MGAVDEEVIRPRDRTVFRRLDEGSGGVLLDLDTADYRHLNETGVLIWTSIGTGTTRRELLARLRSEIADPPEGLEDDVDRFLRTLEERQLITRGQP